MTKEVLHQLKVLWHQLKPVVALFAFLLVLGLALDAWNASSVWSLLSVTVLFGGYLSVLGYVLRKQHRQT